MNILERSAIRLVCAGVAGVFEEVCAVLGWDVADEFGEAGLDGFDGAFGRFAHQGLDFREDLLNRIEVRRILREKKELRLGLADGCSHGLVFVTAEVIHHDNVSFLQGGHKHLFNIGLEKFSVDGAVKHARRFQFFEPERTEKGHRFPVPVRDFGLEALALRTPPMCARHVRLDPRFINENEALRRYLLLVLAPPFPMPADVRPILLGGQNAFF